MSYRLTVDDKRNIRGVFYRSAQANLDSYQYENLPTMQDVWESIPNTEYLTLIEEAKERNFYEMFKRTHSVNFFLPAATLKTNSLFWVSNLGCSS